MLEENKTGRKPKDALLGLSFEEKSNLFGCFELLAKVDKRINPHLYKNKTQEND